MKLRPSFAAAALATIALQACAPFEYNTLRPEGRAELATCYRAEQGQDHKEQIKSLRPELDKAMRGMMAGTDEEYEVLANASLNDFVSRGVCAKKLRIDMDSIPVPVPE